MFLYDSEWKEVEKFHADLRKDINSNVSIAFYISMA